jgi:hypothetical protein
MMKKGEKKMFKPSIKNKLIDIVYEDNNVKIAKYYNKKDEHGFPAHNGLTYVYTFDVYEDKWLVHGVLDFDSGSNGWWFNSNFFDSLEEISEFWHANMFLPPREFVSEKMKYQRKMDSILNGYICEMSEGMMSLSHVG